VTWSRSYKATARVREVTGDVSKVKKEGRSDRLRLRLKIKHVPVETCWELIAVCECLLARR
jgi:hypothetical protein